MFLLLMCLYLMANTAARLLTRTLTKTTRLDPYLTGSLIDIPTSVFAALIGLFFMEGSLLSGVTLPLVLLSSVVGVFQILWGRLSVVSQKHIDTTTYTVIRMLVTPVTILLSSVFLHESLSFAQGSGLLLILAGSFVVSSSGRRLKLQRFNRYELYAASTALFLGANTLVSNFLIDQTSFATSMTVFSFLISLPGLLVSSMRVKQLKRFLTVQDIKLSVALGFTTAIHIASFWGAVAIVDNLSLVSALASFRVITVFAASYVVLSERTGPFQKLAGSSLAVTGLLLTK